MATTSKEGSRRKREVVTRTSINRRASLVPVPAEVPAPKAFFKVVAVLKLVVGFLPRTVGPSMLASELPWASFSEDCICTSLYGAVFATLTWKRIGVFQACACGEQIH